MSIAIPWDSFDLVVFDMDGTLYDQPPLRRRMAGLLAREAIRQRSLSVMRTLAAFRRQREAMANAVTNDFAVAQYRLPGQSPDAVRATVTDWMEQRPLAMLRDYRTPGAATLFTRLARNHAIAIFSDYAAQAKLEALGLSAHYCVTAEDVGRLKPDPAGLLWLMEQAKTTPQRTLMIGDRDERDGEAARRAGVRALIRGRDFRHFDDPIFRHAS